MINEEKAREIASKYERWNQEYDESYGAYNGAIEMAEWKEQQMINKACSWLLLNASVFGYFKKMKLQNMVEEFAKAMKGGEE